MFLSKQMDILTEELHQQMDCFQYFHVSRGSGDIHYVMSPTVRKRDETMTECEHSCCELLRCI